MQKSLAILSYVGVQEYLVKFWKICWGFWMGLKQIIVFPISNSGIYIAYSLTTSKFDIQCIKPGKD